MKVNYLQQNIEKTNSLLSLCEKPCTTNHALYLKLGCNNVILKLEDGSPKWWFLVQAYVVWCQMS